MTVIFLLHFLLLIGTYPIRILNKTILYMGNKTTCALRLHDNNIYYANI